MKVITVASDLNDVGFTEFLNPSCSYYNLDSTVLEYDGVFFSNRLKDGLLNAYIQELDDDEIILFTDATDTVFVAREEEILLKFNKLNAPLVFSAEINCWPDEALQDDYPGPSEQHFRYLNCGAFIGRVDYLKQLYRNYPIFDASRNPRYYWSNQYYWNIIFKNEWPKIQLDYRGDIFYNTAIPITGDLEEFKRNLSDVTKLQEMYSEEKNRLDKEIIFINGRIHNILSNSFPCHLHFPGTISKLLMQRGYFNSLKR